MTNIAVGNPTGITNYDISRFAQQPGWQKLSQVLNEFVLALELDNVTQDDIAEAVAHLARGIAFMDCCQQCERRQWDNQFDSYTDTSAAPYAPNINDGWLHGRYRCEQGHEWTCGYSLRALGAWW